MDSHQRCMIKSKSYQYPKDTPVLRTTIDSYQILCGLEHAASGSHAPLYMFLVAPDQSYQETLRPGFCFSHVRPRFFRFARRLRMGGAYRTHIQTLTDPQDFTSITYCLVGRAIAEAVSRWLPTAVARVQSRLWSSGIRGGQSGVGEGFLRVLRFPLPFIPPNVPSSQSPVAGTIGQ
jgi:hypothetical protein